MVMNWKDANGKMKFLKQHVGHLDLFSLRFDTLNQMFQWSECF